ncbi:protein DETOXIFICATION 45 [Forsythia ovata]|uniref:Protein DETOXIFICATION 45 n=1 Tax=Forsythia ovata TaxID=205694 RepID=A0ABD1VKG8_9LAMI
MVAANLSCGGTVSSGLKNKTSRKWAFSSNHSREFRGFVARVIPRGPRSLEVGVGRCSLSLDKTKGLLSSSIIRQRKPIFSRFDSRLRSDSGVQSYDVEESSVIEEEILPENSSVLK